MNVAEVMGLVDGAEADVVGCADDLPALDAATRHPHGEAYAEVVATFSALGFG